MHGRKNARYFVTQIGASSPTSGGIHAKKENPL